MIIIIIIIITAVSDNTPTEEDLILSQENDMLLSIIKVNVIKSLQF